MAKIVQIGCPYGQNTFKNRVWPSARNVPTHVADGHMDGWTMTSHKKNIVRCCYIRMR